MNVHPTLFSLVPLAVLPFLAPGPLRAQEGAHAPAARQGLRSVSWNAREDDVQESRDDRGQAYLGIAVGAADEGGAVVTRVYEGTAAAGAGLREGDRIVRLGDSAVDDVDAFIDRIRERAPGDRVDLEVRRGDESLGLSVELGERRPDAAARDARRADEPRMREREEQAEDQGQVREEVSELLHRDAERMQSWMERLHEHLADLHEHLGEGDRELQEDLHDLHERHPGWEFEGLDDLFRRQQERRRELAQGFADQMRALQQEGRRDVERWLERRRSGGRGDAGPFGAWFQDDGGNRFWAPDGGDGGRRVLVWPEGGPSGAPGMRRWAELFQPDRGELDQLRSELQDLRGQIGELRDILRELRESRR